MSFKRTTINFLIIIFYIRHTIFFKYDESSHVEVRFYSDSAFYKLYSYSTFHKITKMVHIISKMSALSCCLNFRVTQCFLDKLSRPIQYKKYPTFIQFGQFGCYCFRVHVCPHRWKNTKFAPQELEKVLYPHVGFQGGMLYLYQT